MTTNLGAPSTRRRLPIALLLAMIGIIGGAVVLSLLRNPLNPMEKLVLGEWTFTTADNPAETRHVRFHENRTFEMWSKNTADDGTWRFTDGFLEFSPRTEDDASPMLPIPFNSYGSPPYVESYLLVALSQDRALFEGSNVKLDMTRVQGKQ